MDELSSKARSTGVNTASYSQTDQEHTSPVMSSDATDDTTNNAFIQAPSPRAARLDAPQQLHYCQRQNPRTIHLDKSKPVPDETQANQSALVRFQMHHALSVHRTANSLVGQLALESTDANFVLSNETLRTIAHQLSDYRTQIRTAAHNEFQNQKLNRLPAKLDQQLPADTLTLKGHATQMVMTALRNTLIDQGATVINDQLLQDRMQCEQALKAIFRLAAVIELLEVTRFNPLLAYHDIDHTLSVIQGSMALVAGAYDYAIAQTNADGADVIGEWEDATSTCAPLLRAEKTLALHKSMLFSAAHDSFFEFKPNTIVRNAGRRGATSSEGLSARNLKSLLNALSEKLDHPGLKARLTDEDLHEDIDETIFATVPSFVEGTVINGAQALAYVDSDSDAQQFLVRIATAIADLEECLLPDPTRFITKSLLLNQEGSPVVDMSLIEHRSGVLLALSEQGDELLKNALADETHGAEFAEALESWHRWMTSQPSFARGRQRETANLIRRLIEQYEADSPEHVRTQQADAAANSTRSAATANQQVASMRLALAGLITTLLARYSSPINKAQDSANQTDAPSPDTTLTWLNQAYRMNQAGEHAAKQIVTDLEAQSAQSLCQKDRLLSLAHILKKNLPPEINRLTIPNADSFENLNVDTYPITSDALQAASNRLRAKQQSHPSD